jgi:hypothetical protein
MAPPPMLPLDSLVVRVRGEYREMPGLRLTFAQACRLWQVDTETCEVVLQTLRAEGFLTRTATGMFMALPTPNASASLPLKVGRESGAASMALTRISYARSG